MKKLIYISLPYATFGLVSEDGIITGTAPISKYSLGKDEKSVIQYYRNKKAYIEVRVL